MATCYHGNHLCVALWVLRLLATARNIHQDTMQYLERRRPRERKSSYIIIALLEGWYLYIYIQHYVYLHYLRHMLISHFHLKTTRAISYLLTWYICLFQSTAIKKKKKTPGDSTDFGLSGTGMHGPYNPLLTPHLHLFKTHSSDTPN